MPIDASSLQAAIKELATFPHQPQAPWVAKVTAAPTQVIAGAILCWGPSGTGAYVTATDINTSRREAALAILHARFAGEQARFATEADRQTRQLIYLTWVIAVLTAVMLAAVVVPLFTPTPTHAALMPMPPPK